MSNACVQVFAGVVPPELGEAQIREVFPSVAVMPGPATLGRICIKSIILAPLGWFLLLPIYFLKILPFLAKRYTLTNRRVMIQRGLKPVASGEVKLGDISDVRVVRDANSTFFRCATLEIVTDGKVALTLPAVPEADAFRISIINACKAWAPGKLPAVFVPSK